MNDNNVINIPEPTGIVGEVVAETLGNEVIVEPIEPPEVKPDKEPAYGNLISVRVGKAAAHACIGVGYYACLLPLMGIYGSVKLGGACTIATGNTIKSVADSVHRAGTAVRNSGQKGLGRSYDLKTWRNRNESAVNNWATRKLLARGLLARSDAKKIALAAADYCMAVDQLKKDGAELSADQEELLLAMYEAGNTGKGFAFSQLWDQMATSLRMPPIPVANTSPAAV